MNKLKIYTPFLTVLTLGILITACSENDPLDELGEEKGKVPFVNVSSVDAFYNAGDTINYSVFYWSDRDDIENLSTLIDEQTQLIGTLSVDDGAGSVSLEFDTLFITETAFKGDFDHDPFDYRTDLNQYVRAFAFNIPEKYQLWEIAEAEDANFLKVNSLAFGSEITALVLLRLAQNGISTTWDDLASITTAVELKIESTLGIRARVTDQQGHFNETSASNTKIGLLAE